VCCRSWIRRGAAIEWFRTAPPTQVLANETGPAGPQLRAMDDRRGAHSSREKLRDGLRAAPRRATPSLVGEVQFIEHAAARTADLSGIPGRTSTTREGDSGDVPEFGPRDDAGDRGSADENGGAEAAEWSRGSAAAE